MHFYSLWIVGIVAILAPVIIAVVERRGTTASGRRLIVIAHRCRCRWNTSVSVAERRTVAVGGRGDVAAGQCAPAFLAQITDLDKFTVFFLVISSIKVQRSHHKYNKITYKILNAFTKRKTQTLDANPVTWKPTSSNNPPSLTYKQSVNLKDKIIKHKNIKWEIYASDGTLLTFCDAILPNVVAFSLAVSAILDAPSDSKLQPWGIQRKTKTHFKSYEWFTNVNKWAEVSCFDQFNISMNL